MNYDYFMNIALQYAKKAFEENEVPIGAIIVKNDEILGTGYNLTNKTKISTNHAEIISINNSSLILNEWRLIDCDIYVTLEPCMMCIGAINNCRIRKVIYGAKNHEFGAIQYINPKIQVISGVLEFECGKILSDFFKKIRK